MNGRSTNGCENGTGGRLPSIQPGGGTIMALELAWGRLRRWYLKRFWPGYVGRMVQARQGSGHGAPVEMLDPRDLKYFRNVTDYRWNPQDDPFTWRDHLGLARAGLAEVVIIGGGLCASAILLSLWWPPAAIIPVCLAALVVWFFRDPPRLVLHREGVVLAPADGRIVAIDDVEHPYIGTAAVNIGIFLSVTDVHINRAPTAVTLTDQQYRPGKFLNALRARSARENEQLELHFEENGAPHRRIVVRQIAGAIARRIVCWTAIGERLAPGEKFGMIKIGSRTEILMPKEDLRIVVRVGDYVRAGLTPLACYGSQLLESEMHSHEGYQRHRSPAKMGPGWVTLEKAVR